MEWDYEESKGYVILILFKVFWMVYSLFKFEDDNDVFRVGLLKVILVIVIIKGVNYSKVYLKKFRIDKECVV